MTDEDARDRVIAVKVSELRVIAQMHHQAYHTTGSDAETWQACSRGVCERIRSILQEAGIDDQG